MRSELFKTAIILDEGYKMHKRYRSQLYILFLSQLKLSLIQGKFAREICDCWLDYLSLTGLTLSMTLRLPSSPTCQTS